MNEGAESGGSFVRRMSALARKGRGRRKEPASEPTPPPPVLVTESKLPSPQPSLSSKGAAGPVPPPRPPVAADPFVNAGLAAWNAQHEEWCAGRMKRPARSPPRRQRSAVGSSGAASVACGMPECDEDVPNSEEEDDGFDSDGLYHELLCPQYKPFPRRVKLSKLVEVLVDVWESDGGI